MKAIRIVTLGLLALGVGFFATLDQPQAQANPGTTWTYPAILNTNAATDSGQDGLPHVTSDPTCQRIDLDANGLINLGGDVAKYIGRIEESCV